MQWTATLAAAVTSVALGGLLSLSCSRTESTSDAAAQRAGAVGMEATTSETGTAPVPRSGTGLPLVAQQPLVLDGHLVTLSVNNETGVSLEDFASLAERISGKRIRLRSGDSRDAPNVRLQGTVQVARSRFLSFFRAVAATYGYRCATQAQGESELVDVVPMVPAQRSAGDAPLRFVWDEELREDASGANDAAGGRDSRILTSVLLPPPDGVARQVQLDRYLDGLYSSLTFWMAGDSDTHEELILWGIPSAVREAVNRIPRVDPAEASAPPADPPPNPDAVVESIALRHADAEEVRQFVLLITDAGGVTVDITVRQRDNALIVEGDEEIVSEVRRLISVKDVEKKRD